MFQDKVQKFTLVEVQIGQINTPVYSLPNDDILRNKRIQGITVYRRSGSDGYSPLNRQFITDAAMWKGYLTIQCDNADVLENLPLQHIAINADDRSFFPVDLTGISATKSTISFASASGLTVGESVLLGISYID
jgi:hypothetical protein